MLNQLNGARFSVPSSATLETNAMGRGTMPLIIILYYFHRLGPRISLKVIATSLTKSLQSKVESMVSTETPKNATALEGLQ